MYYKHIAKVFADQLSYSHCRCTPYCDCMWYDSVHIHTYIHASIHTYIHTYMHTYIHTYKHANLPPDFVMATIALAADAASCIQIWFSHVISHLWIRHDTLMNESCRIHACVMTCPRIRHVTLMNESCHTQEFIMSRSWVSYIALMNASCCNNECVMSHTWISHVTGDHCVIGWRR